MRHDGDLAHGGRVGMELVKPEAVRGAFCGAVGVGQVSCCSLGYYVAGGKKMAWINY